MATVVEKNLWKMSVLGWSAILIAVVGFGVLFYDGLSLMVNYWSEREEYSHGFLIPLISLYLIWQRSDRIRELSFTGSWPALLIVAFGLFLLSSRFSDSRCF